MNKGFILLPIVAMTSLVLALLVLGTVQRAARMQRLAAATALATETTSTGLTLRQDAATEVARELENWIRTGATQSLQIQSPFPPAGEKNAATTNTVVLESPPALTLPVGSWNPDLPTYSVVRLPNHRQRLAGSMDRTGFQRTLRYSRNMGSSGALLANQPRSEAVELTFFEFPSQTAVFGRSVSAGNQVIAGSVVARDVRMIATSRINNGVTAWNSITAAAGAILSGWTLRRDVSGRATAEQAQAFTSGANGDPAAEDLIAFTRGDSRGIWLDLGDRTPDAEGVPTFLKVRTGPSRWEAYCAPPYACISRVHARLASAGDSADVRITRTDPSTLEGRVAEPVEVGRRTLTIGGTAWMGIHLHRGPRGETLLVLDPIAFSSPSVYLELLDSAGRRQTSGMFVSLRNAADLGSLRGFSLVTPNTVLLRGEVNTRNPVPFSMIATAVRYGYGHLPATVDFAGQRGNASDSAVLDISRFATAGNTPAAALGEFVDIAAPGGVPPVHLKSWLLLSETTP